MTRALPLLLLLAACRNGAPSRPEGPKPVKAKAEAHKPKGPPSRYTLPMGDGSGKRTPEEIPRDKPETVVFIVLDTVRADHLSLCGYDRPTSPFLTHLRDDFGFSVSCDAYSPGTWTMPSHTSYFTGKTLPEHAHDRLGGTLPDDAGPMLAELFAERGYQTMMFAANTALAKSGLQKGFQLVRIGKDMNELRFPDFARELKQDLSKADAEKPWFLFINLIDAHDPYPRIPKDAEWVPEQGPLTLDVRDADEDERYHAFLRGDMPADKAQRYLDQIRNGYDYGVWQEDQNVRATFQILRELGRLPGPLRVVITADHGEFIGEHGLLRHPTYLYEPAVHVPFLAYDNLREAQLELTAPFAALTAFTLLRDGELPAEPLPVRAWARVMDDRPVKPGEDSTARWTAGQPKLVWRREGVQAFDLVADPGESDPKDPAGHPMLPALATDADAYLEHLERTGALPLDPATVESLRQLGYLH